MAVESSFRQDVINLWKDSYDSQEPILDLLGAPTEKLNLFLHLISGIFIPILIVNTLRLAIEFLPRVGVLLLDHAKITTRNEDSRAKKAAKYVVNSTLKLIKAPLSLLGMLSEWLLDWRRTSIFSFAVAEQPPAEASPPSYVDVIATTPLPSYSAGNPLASQEYAAAPPPYHETTPRDGGVDRVISDNMQRTLWGGSTPEQSPDDLTPPPSYSPR